MKANIFFLAAAAMALTVACNSKPAEQTEPEMTEEQPAVVEEMVEQAPAEDTVAAEPTAKQAVKEAAKAVKKEVKKEVEVVTNEDGTKTVNNVVRKSRNEVEKASDVQVTTNEDGTKTVTGKVRKSRKSN